MQPADKGIYDSLTDSERAFIDEALKPHRPWAVKYGVLMPSDVRDWFIGTALHDLVYRPSVTNSVENEARRLGSLLRDRLPSAKPASLSNVGHRRKRGGTARKADRRRWGIMQEIGCIPCILEDELRGEIKRRGTPPDMDHLVEGYRLGHAYTYSACPYHHRGVPPSETSRIFQLRSVLGPSKAIQARAYHSRYGTDYELLLIQEQEIAVYIDNLVK